MESKYAHTVESPLSLRWDDVTSQYKVGKPNQVGLQYLVALAYAQELLDSNRRLREALEMLLDDVNPHSGSSDWRGMFDSYKNDPEYPVQLFTYNKSWPKDGSVINAIQTLKETNENT